MFADAVATASAKKPATRMHDVRFGSYAEGRCVQTLHVGAFDDEAPVLAEMHDVFIPQHGLQVTGKHHEIYFSDPRKGAPARRRTILRQPVASGRTRSTRRDSHSAGDDREQRQPALHRRGLGHLRVGQHQDYRGGEHHPGTCEHERESDRHQP